MEGLTDVISILPPAWRDAALAAIAFLVTLRTALQLGSVALRRFAGFVASLDVALDGARDWEWPHRIATALDWFDAWLDRLPVKPPFIRSKSR